MDENINLTILNEIAKATRMGLSNITFVSEKVEDPEMKQEVKDILNEFICLQNNNMEQMKKYL